MKLDLMRVGSLITRDRFRGHVAIFSPKGFKIRKNIFCFWARGKAISTIYIFTYP